MRPTATPSRFLIGAIAVASLATAGPRITAIRETHQEPAPAPDVVTSPVAPAPSAVPVAHVGATRTRRADAAPAIARRDVASPAGTAGMRVELDAEGVMAPASSPSELDANRSFEGLTEVVLPDGSVMIDLQGRFQEFTVVGRDASGRQHTRCVHHPGEALDPNHAHDAIETALPQAER